MSFKIIFTLYILTHKSSVKDFCLLLLCNFLKLLNIFENDLIKNFYVKTIVFFKFFCYTIKDKGG